MTNQNETEPKYIVVIGASAGGFTPVVELSAQLTLEMDASLFVVLHHSRLSFSDILIQRIQAVTPFTCKVAEHNEPIKSRHLYLAISDTHLVIEKGKIILGEGLA